MCGGSVINTCVRPQNTYFTFLETASEKNCFLIFLHYTYNATLFYVDFIVALALWISLYFCTAVGVAKIKLALFQKKNAVVEIASCEA
jgi:hypothetical protein